MKHLYTFLFTLLVAAFSSCSEKDNANNTTAKVEAPKATVIKINPKQSDWYTEKLIGKVKLVKDTTYAVIDKPGEPEKAGVLTFKHCEYDGQGMLIASRKSERNDKPSDWKYTYKYDKRGNRIEKNALFAGSTPFNVTSYKYDTTGNMVEEKVVNTDSKVEKIFINKYDKSGNRIEHTWYRTTGSVEMRDVYKYNNNGIVIENDTYYSNSGLPDKAFFTYDAHGNDVVMKNELSRIIGTNTYVYDKTGNWIRKISFLGKKVLDIEERTIEYYQ